jgi:hypothetical protein
MIEITETLLELPLMAHRLDVPLATVQGWIDAGLEQERWNGRVLTSREALLRFQQAGCRASGEPPAGYEPWNECSTGSGEQSGVN